MPPTISFLSDYGHEDDFVGVCHGVMARIAPEARVIDVTHGIPRHNVRAGALVLRNALPYMPPGVHLAIVDPEVGAERRAVAIRCAEDDRVLVGPDNGAPLPRRRALRRGGGGDGHRALAVAPGARLGDVPRARHLRPRGGPARGRGRAGRGR